MAKSWVVAVVILLILAFIFIGIKGSFLGPIGGFAAKVIKPSEVTISGSVSTVGTATYPQSITFVSSGGGSPYVTSATNGQYQITLPNVNTYSVTITWATLGITGGTCNAGTLNLDSLQNTASYNWSC